jgi:hypothetical protein
MVVENIDPTYLQHSYKYPRHTSIDYADVNSNVVQKDGSLTDQYHIPLAVQLSVDESPQPGQKTYYERLIRSMTLPVYAN